VAIQEELHQQQYLQAIKKTEISEHKSFVGFVIRHYCVPLDFERIAGGTKARTKKLRV
jgi:hypothetical protein